MKLNKEEKKKQTQMLNGFRNRYPEKVKRAQELLKEQQSIRKALQNILTEAPCTVPKLASAADIAPHEVLWHIAAMKKYGLVEEDGMDETGDFYLYRLKKGAKS